MKVVALVACVLACVAVARAARFPGETDRVVSLPGAQMPAGFSIFSGYLLVNATTGKHLFYIMVEGTNATTQPLVRFLNGGPGCSSIGGGMFEETGPLIPDESGKLVANPQSWNQYANMLYIESPVGVGFSFSKTPSDYGNAV